MLASEIIRRARSLADIANSDYISHEDETESLYESYKDVYSEILNQSDDYYLITVILNTSTATKLGNSEWELTIPADVSKIRFLDYKSGDQWVSMVKFGTDQRNDNAGACRYRWRGDKLWLIGAQSGGLPPQIRLCYYPPAVKPSVPETALAYYLAYTPAQLATITSPFYFVQPNANNDLATDYLLYILGGITILLDSVRLGTHVTLYTGTGLSQVKYYAGYVYYLKGGDIYRAATDFASTLVPTMITAVGTIVSYTIADNVIYYSTASLSFTCTLAGAGAAQVQAFATRDMYNLGTTFIRVSTGFIYANSVTTAIAATSLAWDGTAILYLTSAFTIRRYLSATDDTLLYAGILSLGPWAADRIPVQDMEYHVSALSSLPDTDLEYPSNAAYEVTAYQSAIDYKRKAQGDTTALELRLAKLKDRMSDELRRDDYQPEHRVNENRQAGWNY